MRKLFITAILLGFLGCTSTTAKPETPTKLDLPEDTIYIEPHELGVAVQFDEVEEKETPDHTPPVTDLPTNEVTKGEKVRRVPRNYKGIVE